MQNKNGPNLFIAGVNKAGTTSLFSYLSSHDEVCPSSIKETCYFLPLRYGEALAPYGEYMRLFKHWAGQKYVMEATPGYFYGGGEVAGAIRDHAAKPRILILFRNPTKRAFSYFRSLKGKTVLPPEMSFGDYIETCQRRVSNSDLFDRRQDHFYRGLLDGFYIDYLDAWLDVFGESLRVLFFEHLKSDPLLFMTDLCNWLGIDNGTYAHNEFAVENRTRFYRHKSLHKAAIGVNKLFEGYLRRYPRIKQVLRRYYFSVNEAQNADVMSEDERQYLDSMYSEPNRALRSRLMEKGYQDFPDWLGDQADTKCKI